MKLVTDEEAAALLNAPPTPSAGQVWAARYAVFWWFVTRLCLALIALYALIRFIKWAWTD